MRCAHIGFERSPQVFSNDTDPITATHTRPIFAKSRLWAGGTDPPPPPILSSPRGRGLVEPYRPLGPLSPRTVWAVARLGSHPVADGHLIDVAALAAPPCGLAAYGLTPAGFKRLFMRGCRPAPIRPKHALRHDTFDASEPHLQLLGDFAGRTSPKRHNTPAFPQVAEVDSERHLPKTAQKSKTHGEVGAHFLRNHQQSRGATEGNATAAASVDASATCTDQMAASVKTRYLRCSHWTAGNRELTAIGSSLPTLPQLAQPTYYRPVAHLSNINAPAPLLIYMA